MSALKQLNIGAGRLFFRFRNAIFPILFVLFLTTMRPAHLFPPALDRWIVVCGFLSVFAGQMVRLTTIGFDYIDRGGKKGRPAASRLVTGGIYAHTRNPMYLGNILIASGFALVSSSLLAYLTIIPFFLYVYQAITCAEEDFLVKEFGTEYADYCARVPRFFPDPRGLFRTMSSGTYDWRKAVRHDLSTIAWVSIVLAAIPLWRAYFLGGPEAASGLLLPTVGAEGGILCLYAALVYFKRRKLFFYPASH